MNYHESLFQQKETKSKHSPQQISNGFNLPKLSNNEIKLCSLSIIKGEHFET